MGRLSRPFLALAVLAAALGFFAVASARPADASDVYQRALNQPCIACHTTGVDSDLNTRGQAFAAVANHEADPNAAWEVAVQAVPLKPSTDSSTSILVPIAVAALLTAWLVMMLRRRRATAS